MIHFVLVYKHGVCVPVYRDLGVNLRFLLTWPHAVPFAFCRYSTTAAFGRVCRMASRDEYS